jgi:hypothetical protein
MNALDNFKSKAPWIMDQLKTHFSLTTEEAAAIVGNAGHESLGLTVLQEMKPTVPGSQGGYGWFQWTGPRRRAYKAWADKKGLDIASDMANYGFLRHELNTAEISAIPKLKKAIGLKAKVIAFELAYERAGVKHYESRLKYAEAAMAAYAAREANYPGVEAPTPPTPKAGITIQQVMALIAAVIAAVSGWLFTRG